MWAKMAWYRQRCSQNAATGSHSGRSGGRSQPATAHGEGGAEEPPVQTNRIEQYRGVELDVCLEGAARIALAQ